MTAPSIDLTQGLGVGSFVLAALACLHAGRSRRRPWLTLAVLQGLFAAELLLGWRYRLHDVASALLRAEGAYDARAPWQLALIAAVLALSAGATLALMRRRPGPLRAGAAAGSMLAGLVFSVETISLHAVDAALYAMAGPVRVIGWLWLLAGALTVAAALARSPLPSPDRALKRPAPTRPRR